MTKNNITINSGTSPMSAWSKSGNSRVISTGSNGTLKIKNSKPDLDPQLRLKEGVTVKVDTIDGKMEYEVEEVVTDDDGKAIGYWFTSGVHREWFDQEEMETMYETDQLTLIHNEIDTSNITINVKGGKWI